MQRCRRAVFVFVAFAAAICSIASAQPLTDRVPADALVYVGWRGTDALGATYANSHLAAVINASKFPQLWDDAMTQLIARLPQDKPQEAAAVQTTIPLLKHAWKRPTALFVTPGTDKRGQFEPRLAIVCDAGAVAADVHKALAGLIAQGRPDSRLRTALDGHIVILTIGYDDALAATKPPSSLRDAQAFKSSLQQLDTDPVYATYVDLERAVQLIDQAVAKGRDKSAAAAWPKISAALGLPGLKRYASTGAFVGKDWSTHSFIDAPEPRNGVVSLLDTQPIGDGALAAVPQSAAYAGLHQFDLGKLFAQVRAALNAAGPPLSSNFEKFQQAVNGALGQRISDILDPLGDQWLMYADAGVGGVTEKGLVVSNTLADPAKAETALTKLSNTIARFASNPQSPFRLTYADTELGDHLTVHCFTAAQGRVGWIVKNNRLFFAFKPETVGAATLVGAQGAASFATNAKFIEVRKKLGDKPITGFEFQDLPQSIGPRNDELQQSLPLLSMLATNVGIVVPPDLLPKLDVLKQNVFPSGSITWVDKNGWHSRSISPFPGSTVYSANASEFESVGGGALLVSVLLPSLNRARETANRVKCASNMRQIGQAILLYSNDHHGQYPESIGSLLKTEDITIEVFTCPSGDIEPPADILNAADIAKKVAWVDTSSPYKFIGKGLRNNADADTLVLYEREDDHNGDGMNMLFADGSVYWYDMATAKKVIADKKRPQQ